MSLQVWLPLNGNLNNQGLSNVTITNYGATIDNNGKIGKCYYFNGSSYIKISLPSSITSLKNTSICMWVKGNQVFGGISHDGNADVPCMTCVSTNWQFTNGSSWKHISGGAYNDGNWHHVVCTMDDTTIRTYIDGSLVATNSISSLGIITDLTSSNFIELGCDHPGGDEYLTGYMNDFRVYDHCLSAKEVKEISKGLVCHYPLKSQYETGQVNKYSGDVAEGSLSIDSRFTKTKLEDERGYNYKISYTGNGNNTWPNMSAGSTFSFTVGKKYYYSCKVRCHSTNFALYLRASRSGNDWVTNATNVLNPDGEWHEYVVYQTINSTYDRSGSTVTCDPILEFYAESLATSGKVYSADFDIKDIQVIESDCYVPFIDNNMVSNVVSDCSGYGNNGMRVGNITRSNDSSRYSGSYGFNGIGHIKTGFSATMNELSCSFWVKPNSNNGGYAIIASNYNNPSSGFWIAINCEGSGLWFYNGAYVKGNSLLSNDVWYHGVFTYNNGIGKWYLNGELVTTADISSRGTSLTISNLSIGNSFTGTTWDTEFYGNISDFRLYSKCLSAEDVKALYNVSASIDKTGVLSAYEFVEEG